MGLDPTFERWLSDEGVTFDRTAIEFVRRRRRRHPNARAFHNDDDDDDDTKVVAKRALKDGEKVVEIPLEACFAYEQSLLRERVLTTTTRNKNGKENEAKTNNEKWKKMTRALHEDSDWLSQLAMALCFERFLESTSRFGPYLKTLNERERHAMCNWEEKEKNALLEGTDIGLNYVRDECANAKEEYERFRAALPAGADEEHFSSFFTFDRYRASRSVCSSRAFQITPGKIGLMPLADLFNHKSLKNDVAVCEGDRAETVAVAAVKSVPKGSEVFNTYGVLSNTDLLNSYGFCDGDAIDIESTAPRITTLSVRQLWLIMNKTGGCNKLPDAFREDDDTHTIEEVTRLLRPGREDVLRSIFLHRLKMYPNPSAFERACEEYLLAGEGETDTEERMLLKKERVELARTCRQSEMRCFERAIEAIGTQTVSTQECGQEDTMFSVFV